MTALSRDLTKSELRGALREAEATASVLTDCLNYMTALAAQRRERIDAAVAANERTDLDAEETITEMLHALSDSAIRRVLRGEA